MQHHNENLQRLLEKLSTATVSKIAEEQPRVCPGYIPDRRSYFRLPLRACWMVRKPNDWRVLAAICATSSWAGICYASQQYIGELCGIIHGAQVSNAVKGLHEAKLIRLLLPKGKPYPGRFQRSNRMQVLYEEDAPLPSQKELMLNYGARTNRWK
jgi:hypothetical protein